MSGATAEAVVDGLSFEQLQGVVDAALAKMEGLRAGRLKELAGRLDTITQTEVGMTAREVLRAARKQERELSRLQGEDQDIEEDNDT